jgi:FixJ family two-component response regulator
MEWYMSRQNAQARADERELQAEVEEFTELFQRLSPGDRMVVKQLVEHLANEPDEVEYGLGVVGRC